MEDYIRLLFQQLSLFGGTSLITMYIPPNGRVSLSKVKSRTKEHESCSKISIIAIKPAK